MEYFDSHAHYNDEKYNEDREEIINKIYKSGVTKCINVGYSLESTKQAIEIAKKHDFIYVAAGIHPEELPQTEEELWKQIENLKKLIVENKKIVAIGEIGLDYHWNDKNIDLQKEAFIAQINLANELDLPVIIHTRDAIDDTINIIRNNKFKKNAVLHCCPFNRELVKHGLDAELYIAFGGTSTFKNSKNAEEIVDMVPMNKLLIETDCPYLAPEPVRGTRNDSSNLQYIVKKLAELKKVTPEEIAKNSYNNAVSFFNIHS